MPSLQGNAATAKCCSERPGSLPRFAIWTRPDREAVRACPSVPPVPPGPETCPDRCAHLARCRVAETEHRNNEPGSDRSAQDRVDTVGRNTPVLRSERAG